MSIAAESNHTSWEPRRSWAMDRTQAPMLPRATRASMPGTLARKVRQPALRMLEPAPKTMGVAPRPAKRARRSCSSGFPTWPVYRAIWAAITHMPKKTPMAKRAGRSPVLAGTLRDTGDQS